MKLTLLAFAAMMISNFAFTNAEAAASVDKLKAVAPGSKAEAVANAAASIFSVKNVKYAGKTYRFVTMDSALNGDLNQTTVLLVGDEVGGEAGYDAAFVLTSTENGFWSMNLLGTTSKGIKISLTGSDAKTTQKVIRFNPKTSELIEATTK